MTLISDARVEMPATPPAQPDLDTFRERLRADGVRFLLAMFVDVHGKPCAKLVPVEALEMLLRDGAGFAGYAAGALGQSPADPDLVAMPDLSSYAPLPFVRPGLGAVQCDLYVEGRPWPFAPRQVLRDVLARLSARGMTAKTGAEAEYFLVRRAADGSLQVADDRDRAAAPCYDARGVIRMYEHLTAVSTALNELGWGNYANDHEDANGQFEQNFAYDDALVTADRIVLFRYLVHMLAEERGMTATFMPKPFGDRTGSGMHLHVSLWDAAGDEPLFPHPDDERLFGLSSTAYAFAAGVLAHAPAVLAVTCPTVNSYKRLGAPRPNSGATWAPTTATYGGNDRTHFVRIPAGDRIEVRGVDGAANPYLATAALLVAGLDGIDRSLDPGEPGAPGAQRLPRTLLEAAEALAADDVVTAALGELPDGRSFADWYAELKSAEFLEWHARVSDWEVERYLTAI